MNLVTGGTGLVGSHIILDLLKKDLPVRALKRSKSNLEPIKSIFDYYKKNDLYDKIEWVEGDVLDIPSLELAMDQIDNVYHAAALVSFHKKHFKRMYDVNVKGTTNIVNQALSSRVKKIGHVSSIAAIGRSNTHYFTEENKWKNDKNNSYYAITKYGAEREIWRGINEGLPAVIVNPGIIIGPSNWNRSSTTLFKNIHKGLKYYTEGVNGFVDVRDVSKALISLTNSQIHSEKYILVSENLSYKEVFSEIAKSLNKEAPNKLASKTILEIAWRLALLKSYFTGKTPPITKETARTTSQQFYYDSTKIKNELSFEFYSTNDAIKNAANYFLEI